MIQLGLTQRVDLIEDYSERRDALDQSWYEFLERIDFSAIPIPNNLSRLKEWVCRQKIDGLILTGGNDLASLAQAEKASPERDRTEAFLLTWAIENKLPVLGVCRGMQFINLHFGGKLRMIEGHVAVKHRVTPVLTNKLFSCFTEVNSFHKWGMHMEDLATTCKATILGSDGTVEAFKHYYLPIYGVMWHPERDEFSQPCHEIFFRHIFNSDDRLSIS